MAERIADNADLAVDELKRRARRRLVGAIVLALAAAVILPMLLEKDPKPLGDDVSVQIPPVDEGRFINRLTGREPASAAKSDTRSLPKNAAPKIEAPALTPAPTPPPTPAPITAVPPAAPVTESAPAPVPANAAPPKKSVADAEQRVLSPGPKPATKENGKTELKASAEAKSDVKASPTAEAAVSVPPVADVAAPAASQASKAEGFAVQIAAFTDDKGANALAGKLKRAGYASTYTEPVETSRGTLWRVRVGGYGTRPEAEAVRAKLKTEGWNGLVVAAK
jgi:DedD protein